MTWQYKDDVMLKKKETEEHSRECLRSKKWRHLVRHELDEWRAGFHKITTLAKSVKLFCCMFFHFCGLEFMTIPRISICLIDGSKS